MGFSGKEDGGAALTQEGTASLLCQPPPSHQAPAALGASRELAWLAQPSDSSQMVTKRAPSLWWGKKLSGSCRQGKCQELFEIKAWIELILLLPRVRKISLDIPNRPGKGILVESMQSLQSQLIPLSGIAFWINPGSLCCIPAVCTAAVQRCCSLRRSVATARSNNGE